MVPPTLVRLLERRHEESLAHRLLHWTPATLAVPLDDELLALISYRRRGTGLVM
jgi:hypothetical protein